MRRGPRWTQVASWNSQRQLGPPPAQQSFDHKLSSLVVAVLQLGSSAASTQSALEQKAVDSLPTTGKRQVSAEVDHLLRDLGLEGQFAGSDLQSLINQRIVPHLSERIVSSLGPFSKRKTIEYLGARLGKAARAHAETVVLGRENVSTEVWRHSVSLATGSSRSWQLILELALARPPSGTKSLRALNDRKLLRHADDLYFWSQLSDRLHYSLGDPILIVNNSNSLVAGLHQTLDIGRWNHDLAKWMKGRGTDEQFGPLGELAVALAERRSPPDTAFAAKADAAFCHSLGFSLSTLVSLMGALAENSKSLVSRSSQLIKR